MSRITNAMLGMWEVARICKPGITWPEFTGMWERFVQLRRDVARKRALQ